MRILLTGASSFTGYWFARLLAEGGHEVIAPLRSAPEHYTGRRAARVAKLEGLVRLLPHCPFGSPPFLALIEAERFDFLCHHAAEVGDYRSPDFDVTAALAANTRGLPEVLRKLAEKGLRGVVLTCSVFAPDEGMGEAPLRAFSPYGLSKGLTTAVFRHWCQVFGLPFGRFVISNPFGPLEELRFCAYLLRTWQAGETAEVRTPRYVRDNVPVRLLARAYVDFVLSLPERKGESVLGPSLYAESQGAFAERFAREVRARTKFSCALRFAEQSDFSEPLIRINTHPLTLSAGEEKALWDEYIELALAEPQGG
jgi:UDP-glucose 4-epimerase